MSYYILILYHIIMYTGIYLLSFQADPGFQAHQEDPEKGIKNHSQFRYRGTYWNAWTALRSRFSNRTWHSWQPHWTLQESSDLKYQHMHGWKFRSQDAQCYAWRDQTMKHLISQCASIFILKVSCYTVQTIGQCNLHNMQIAQLHWSSQKSKTLLLFHSVQTHISTYHWSWQSKHSWNSRPPFRSCWSLLTLQKKISCQDMFTCRVYMHLLGTNAMLICHAHNY